MTHRLANNNDFEAVYELYMDESANPYLSYDPMSTEEFEPRFASILKTETLYVVEDDNGKIIASYRIIPKTDRQKHTVYLGGFVVAPHNQGKGVGSKVMSVIKEHCANDGKSRIELTVDPKNDAAIALYKKMGFQVEGTLRRSFRLSSTNQFYDEYLMAVLL